MALTTYSELQTAVADWAHRSASQVTDFISLAEKRINSDLESRLSEIDATLTAVLDSRYIALPDGFIYPLALWRDYPVGTRFEMTYVVPEMMNATNNSSLPNYYTIDGSNIAFECPHNDTYSYIFRYKKKYDLATDLTNDILTNYSGLYLFGALVEFALFSRDFDMMDRWELRYQSALADAIKSESQNKANATLFFDEAIVGHSRPNIYDGDR